MSVRLTAAAGAHYPWIAMGVVLIGTFMVILDTTITNVALPTIGEELHQTASLDWIVTGYLLSVGLAQPATGWLADRFGRHRMFTFSLGAFAVGSLLCAMAPSLQALVVFRILQGLGGGAMMPVGMAMIYELFPPDRRGRALGIWGIAAMAAPAIGPVLGGWLVTNFSWRSIFYVNVPIGAVGVVAALLLLRDTGFRERRPFDRAGMALATGALVALLLAFSRARDWGWAAPQTVALVLGGVALGVAYGVHSSGTRHPMIDLGIFRVRTFSLTIGIVWLVTAAQFARLVFIPLELESVRGLTALEAGMVMAPAALATAVTMPIGGRLADALGARVPVGLGAGLIAAGVYLLSTLSLTTPTWQITIYLAVQASGVGLALMPSSVVAMNSLPSRYVAQASAVRSVNRQVAGALSVGLLSTFVATRIGAVSAGSAASASVAQAAYNDVFLLSLGGVLLALALVPFLPGRDENRRMQHDRQRELDEVAVAVAD